MKQSDNLTIRELNSKAELLDAFTLVKELSPQITIKGFREMFASMSKQGYRLYAVFSDNGECAAITGVWRATKFYSGKYMEIDNFIVREEYRSKRVGRFLLEYVERMAKEENCETLMLDAYVENRRAHKFYYENGYSIRGFHFLKRMS